MTTKQAHLLGDGIVVAALVVCGAVATLVALGAFLVWVNL